MKKTQIIILSLCLLLIGSAAMSEETSANQIPLLHFSGRKSIRKRLYAL